MKQCPNCAKEFEKRSKIAIYCSSKCRGDKWRRENPNDKKEWYLKNKEQETAKVKEYQRVNKKYLAKKHNEYMKTRKKSDISFKLACSIRIRINAVLKGKNKNGSAVDDLGCSIIELKKHLESQFKSGMTWGNHGKVWHIDHIKPLKTFNLEDREQFLEACCYINLQPLLIEDHIAKTTRENRK